VRDPTNEELNADDLEAQLPAAEREMAATLASLRPASPSGADAWVERALAGPVVRSSGRQLWVWRGIAAALAVGLGGALLLRPEPRVVERVVVREVAVRETVPTPPIEMEQLTGAAPARAGWPARVLADLFGGPVAGVVEAPDSDRADESYVALRARVVERGVDVLRPAAGAPSGRPGAVVTIGGADDVARGRVGGAPRARRPAWWLEYFDAKPPL